MGNLLWILVAILIIAWLPCHLMYGPQVYLFYKEKRP